MAEAEEPTRLVGVVDVVVHEARDIQNICIYHKQDVYAKLRLTTDAPGSAVSTRTVNGGGRNPVFNQTLRLGVRSAGPPPPSVRCEVWMLSRVRNFLEDQLLGFALVPLSDVAAAGGRLAGGDFPLSSTDLSRSPSGFVKLSVEYTGSLTELMPVDVAPPPPPPVSAATTTVLEEEDSSVVVPCELSKIEFPDLKAADENNMMVSEYFGIPCTSSIMDTPEDDDDDDCPNHQAGVRVVESFTAVARPDDHDTDTPATSPSAGSPPPPPQQKDRSTEDGAGSPPPSTTTEVASPPAPVISVDIVPPQHSVVRQDIVDMYTRSMQQFTESLANMKLPMDVVNSNGNDGGGGNVDAANGDSGADQKLPAAKKTNSRVFYGSRAFF